MISVLDLIDHLALSVERAHLTYQITLKSLLGEFLDRPDSYTPRARDELRSHIHDARVATSNSLDGIILEGTDSVMEFAEHDAGGEISDDLQNDLSELDGLAVDSALAQINDALRMDESSVLASVRKIQLNAAMKVAQGIDPKVAFDMVKGGAIVGLAFTRKDRAGTNWSTSVYTRTVARALAVNSYTETFLMYLLSAGTDVAAIEDDDGDQVAFSITGMTPDLPTLTEIQAQYLHPNASRLVTRWTDKSLLT